jgi:hypothetical protein
MAMKKTSGGDSLLRQGAGKSFWTLPIFGSMAVADRDVFWKSDRVLRFFSSGGLYRRRGNVKGGARRPHMGPMGPRVWPRHPCVWGPGGPSYSSSDLWKLPGKIRFQKLVSSNSENISCVSLLKHKNSRKQGTGTVATR